MPPLVSDVEAGSVLEQGDGNDDDQAQDSGVHTVKITEKTAQNNARSETE